MADANLNTDAKYNDMVLIEKIDFHHGNFKSWRYFTCNSETDGYQTLQIVFRASKFDLKTINLF